MRSKSRDQYQSDNRETNDKLNPLYTLSTMINIFHDKEVFNSRFSVIMNYYEEKVIWIIVGWLTSNLAVC